VILVDAFPDVIEVQAASGGSVEASITVIIVPKFPTDMES